MELIKHFQEVGRTFALVGIISTFRYPVMISAGGSLILERQQCAKFFITANDIL